MANANSMVGNFSQRRVEAIKFLSSISLDGTRCSSVQKFHAKENGVSNHYARVKFGSVMKGDVKAEGGSKIYSSSPLVTNHKYDTADCCAFSSDPDNFVPSVKPILDEPIQTKSILSHSTSSKKRTRPPNGNSETKTTKTSSTGKKLQHASTCSDSEQHFGSSCESIGPVTSRLKTKGSKSKASVPKVKFVKSIKDHKFHGERIMMVTRNRVPFLVCSVIPYGSAERNRSDFHKDVLKKRHTARSRPLSTTVDASNSFELFGIIESEDGEEVSYGKLLVPTRSLKDHLDKKHVSDGPGDTVNPTLGLNRHLLARCYSYDQGAQRGMAHSATSPPLLNPKENRLVYNPTLLDDPELIAGKHRTLLTFSSYVTSIIDFVRPDDLKKEINDKFKEKFPHVKLTLSKLRSIKKEMCKIARNDSGAEFVTVAQAYVYFEKLILRGLINKQNRKLCAAASLLLSAKLNDFKGDCLRTLIERIESVFRLNRKELFESEFAVLVALEFGLHIPASEVFPHYQRLLYES